MINLQLGDWRTALDGITGDALICDPPYGARTHRGHNSGARSRRDPSALITYSCFTPDDVHELVASWAPRIRGWMACMTSADLIPVYQAAYAKAGLYGFAPVPVLQHRPRLTGDGPGSGAVYLMVARPRHAPFSRWGSLPCWYLSSVQRGTGVVGAKPVALMEAIIADYTKPGDLVVDPFAGSGSTLIAARRQGRQAVGCEIDPDTYERTRDRLDGSLAT